MKQQDVIKRRKREEIQFSWPNGKFNSKTRKMIVKKKIFVALTLWWGW